MNVNPIHRYRQQEGSGNMENGGKTPKITTGETRTLSDFLELESLQQAAQTLKDFHGIVRIISHHDSDGLTSAAIMAAVLKRLGKRFQLTITKSQKKEKLSQIRHEGLLIFTDIGLSYLGLLAGMENARVIILDHHRTETDPGENTFEISARSFGLDGGRDCCGATLSFLFALAVSEENWDLLPLALTGMIGDHQYIHISGLNRAMVEAGRDKAIVTMRERSLNICGKTLEDALLAGTQPFFRGISGRKDRVDEYIQKIGWETGKKLSELDPEENRYLLNIFSTELLKNGASPSTVREQCVTKFYAMMELNKGRPEAVDLRSFSQLVDACGRKKDYAQGIALCLGDFSGLGQAKLHQEKVNELLMQALVYLERGRIRKKKGIQYFTNPESSISSPLSGISMQYLLSQERVTLILSEKDLDIHVSARGVRELIDAGLDLSMVMREAAKAAGGQGGGHDIAAGAGFPKENLQTFLDLSNQLVCEQLGREL